MPPRESQVELQRGAPARRGGDLGDHRLETAPRSPLRGPGRSSSHRGGRAIGRLLETTRESLARSATAKRSPAARAKASRARARAPAIRRGPIGPRRGPAPPRAPPIRTGAARRRAPVLRGGGVGERGRVGIHRRAIEGASRDGARPGGWERSSAEPPASPSLARSAVASQASRTRRWTCSQGASTARFTLDDLAAGPTCGCPSGMEPRRPPLAGIAEAETTPWRVSQPEGESWSDRSASQASGAIVRPQSAAVDGGASLAGVQPALRQR